MKFSSIFLPFCALVAVTSCAYIIPPEQNTPRTNTVIGEPHRPQLNNSSMGSGLGPRSAATPRSAPAQNITRNDAPALPPVDAATQAQAEQEMAMAQPAPIAVAPTAAPVAAAAPVSNGRRVPIENTQFQVSANDSYPSLMTVPERPVLSGPDSSKERLSAVQSDLQQDRAAAQASKDALSRDAAAEPSMLSQLPNTSPAPTTGYVVPPNDPVVPQPALNAAPANSVVVPPRDSIRMQPGASAAPAMQPQAQISFKPLPTEPVVTAAPVPVAEAAPRIVMPATSQTAMNVPTFAPPAPMNGASAPAVRTTPAPIVLMRPVENPSSGIAAQDLPAPTMNIAGAQSAPITLSNPTRPNVKKGDFDPLAAADNAPITTVSTAASAPSTASTYASTAYMPASRYAARR